MKQQRTLRFGERGRCASGHFLFQETWALAGVHRKRERTVRDNAGAASGRSSRKSRIAVAEGDGNDRFRGHFVLLSLAPDSYTLSLSKTRLSEQSVAGTVVFADQTQQVANTLDEDAQDHCVPVTSARGLVAGKNPAVGGDLYGVNLSASRRCRLARGGGNLNSAYSAIAVGSPASRRRRVAWLGFSTRPTFAAKTRYYTGFEYEASQINRSVETTTPGTESSPRSSELARSTPAAVPHRLPRPARLDSISHKTGNLPGLRDGQPGDRDPAVSTIRRASGLRLDPRSHLQLLCRPFRLQPRVRFFDNTKRRGVYASGRFLFGRCRRYGARLRPPDGSSARYIADRSLRHRVKE